MVKHHKNNTFHPESYGLNNRFFTTSSNCKNKYVFNLCSSLSPIINYSFLYTDKKESEFFIIRIYGSIYSAPYDVKEIRSTIFNWLEASRLDSSPCGLAHAEKGDLLKGKPERCSSSIFHSVQLPRRTGKDK
jgi:hypothetical protein